MSSLQSASLHNWHLKLGHVHARTLMHMTKHLLIPLLPSAIRNLRRGVKLSCMGCHNGKLKTKLFRGANHHHQKRAHISSDVCGPISPQSRHGNSYFITFVDARTRYTLFGFLRKRSEVPTHIFKALHYVLTFTRRYPQLFGADYAKNISLALSNPNWTNVEYSSSPPHVTFHTRIR